jgi:hypothetical protein
MPALSIEVMSWFLSPLFFVSGYLTCTSFNSKNQGIRKFLAHRLIWIYLPFVLIMALYVLTDSAWQNYTWQGFMAHSTVAPAFFAVFGEGEYLIGQFFALKNQHSHSSYRSIQS